MMSTRKNLNHCNRKGAAVKINYLITKTIKPKKSCYRYQCLNYFQNILSFFHSKEKFDFHRHSKSVWIIVIFGCLTLLRFIYLSVLWHVYRSFFSLWVSVFLSFCLLCFRPAIQMLQVRVGKKSEEVKKRFLNFITAGVNPTEKYCLFDKRSILQFIKF